MQLHEAGGEPRRPIQIAQLLDAVRQLLPFENAARDNLWGSAGQF